MTLRPLFVLTLCSLAILASPSPLLAAKTGKISKDQKKTFSVAMKAMRAGDYPSARQNFQSLLQTKPDWGLVHLQLGQMALNTDANTSRAVKHLRKASSLIPTNPRAHHQLGIAHQLNGNCATALKSFEKAIELRNTYLAAHISQSQCEETLGKKKAAIETLETILSLKRNHEGAIGNLARLYETQGKPVQAEKMLTRLTKLQPKAFAYYLALGNFYQRQGNLKDAKRAFDKANALNPRKRRKMRPLLKSRDAP
jgi:tetratricopeptide (TPR) repeat protein